MTGAPEGTSRRARVATLALYPFLALLSFPTLGHLLFGRDGVAYRLDTFDLARTGTGADWLANGIQLWNTHLTAGNSLFAQQSNTPLGFDVLLSMLVGPFWAYVAFVWLLTTVAGIGMHLFLRDSLQLGPVAVFAGAVLFMFGFWHYIYGLAAPAIPLLFWLMDRAVEPRPGRWRFFVGGIAATAFVLYHGLSQVVLFAGAALFVYLLVTRPPGGSIRDRLAVFLATWGLALAIYAPLVATQLVMLPISVRAHWDLEALYPPVMLDGLRSLVADWSAVLVGVPAPGGLGASPGRYGTFYLGLIGVPLIVLGLVTGRRDRRTMFLLGALLVLPAWDVLAFLSAPILAQLGFLRSFQLDRLRHIAPFVLAALAAIGVQALAGSVLRGGPLPSRGRWTTAAIGASLVPGIAALLLALVEVVGRRRGLMDLREPALGWLLLLAALMIGSLLAVSVGWLARRVRGERRRAGAMSIALALVALLVVERAAYAWGERLADAPNVRGTWSATIGTTPARRFLAAQPGIDVDRVLTFGITPNALAANGMLEVGGYQSLYPETYHRFFGALVAPALEGDPSNTTYYWAWGNRVKTFGPEVDPELVALSGARWLLVRGEATPTVPGIVERFRAGREVVYEVPSVLPRAGVLGAIRVATDDDALLDGLASADLGTLGSTAFVAAGPEADALIAATGLPPASTAPAGAARISSYTPDRVEVDVSAAGPGVLLLTDVMAPGWLAERDGLAVPIATVDVAFRGVAVDAGTRKVVFSYRPGFTSAGFAIAALALVMTAVLGLAVRRRERPADRP